MAQLGGLLQGSAATRPKNIYSGSNGLAQCLPKNEFSSDTHLPCRVPKWSLYITHGVAPMCFVPVSSNEAGPHAQAGRVPTWSLYNTRWVADSCTHSLHKNEFSQDTHLPYRDPHGPSTTPMGSHTCAWPRQLNPAACPKNTYSGSHQDTFAQGLPKKRVCPEYLPGESSTQMVPL